MISLCIPLVICILFIDQWTKKRAKEILVTQDVTQDIEKGFFRFSIVKNKGAFRGFLKNQPLLLKMVHVVSVVFVLAMFIESVISKRNKGYQLGLILMIGGALGNLVDRLKDGYVTDFIAIKWTKNLFYNFADFFIFLGALVTTLCSIKK